MYEVEVKVPAALEPVRERLEALEATHRGVVVQEDTYYDAPHRSFAETDEALRIRRQRQQHRETTQTPATPATARITYKGPLLETGSKTRAEHETGVEDGATMAAICDHLGFEPAATVRKERERYTLEGYTITLDSVVDVGTFVEVEREVDDDDAIETAQAGAFALLERLGLDPDDQLRTSYLELLLEE